ncbi:CamS family sex pheromone protein [Tuanshanicoccus lijuaniae]|uniref:CamS family sex pheromone protein n=1 Tax=Aerococcaceae bacterium zg-1292 TaxID=2774330 RepID=UPI001BD8CC1D|nr:CamS family sex pheromone protein [Aerococcaceae bacterium zg-A91]MBS4458539.1 CamS family sex pheromone protein [Aerococcaceae bacterium zg-BR33]
MNKKWIKATTYCSIVALLSGCLSNLDKEVNDKSKSADQVAVQSTANQLSNDFYRAVITDGRYQMGISASSNTNLSSPGNVLAFEEGLMRISKGVFPTDQYFLREGQIIDEETMTSWLSRESEDNPEGLNPSLARNERETQNQDSGEEKEETTEGEQSQTRDNSQVIVDSTSTPIYLTQIMEKNLMVETEKGYALAGIVIGLAMNSVYEYTDSEGVRYEQEISLGEMRERARAYANIIVGRLRNTEALRSIPIVVGLFRQSGSKDIVGGTYVMHGISREGNYVSDWTEQNEYRVALPMANSSDLNGQYTYFNNFMNQVKDFFPHLNGITGDALYIDNALASLNIKIVTQFYQQTEITALAQHVTDVANKQLPEGVPIEISIVSAHGAEALISRKADETQFKAHIYKQ